MPRVRLGSAVDVEQGASGDVRVKALGVPVALLGDEGEQPIGIGMGLGLLGVNEQAQRVGPLGPLDSKATSSTRSWPSLKKKACARRRMR